VIILLLLACSFLILVAIILSLLNGYRNHHALLFYAFIQVFYLLVTPWVNYIDSDFYAFSTKLSYYDYAFGLLILFIHLFSFYSGYLIFHFSKSEDSNKQKNVSMIEKSVTRVYVALFIIIAINAAMGDISLYDILLGKEEGETLGFKGGSNWISSMADSLIILMCMSHYFGSPYLFRCVIYPLTIFLFLILGFRYRLLLVFFAFTFSYLKKNIIRLNKVLKVLAVLIFSFYLFFFFSENRINFYSNTYSNLKYSPLEFNYRSINENTLGSIVDFALIKSLQNGNVEYDLGESMFLYPIIMILPSSFFQNGEKPYPAPQIMAIDNALNVPRSYGQACTFIGMSYFAFSWIGVIGLSFLFGILASFLEFTNNNDKDFFFKLAILLASFQLYTRGYLGLFLLPLVYMLLAVYLVRYKIVFSKANK
jgi:hypothetical protein